MSAVAELVEVVPPSLDGLAALAASWHEKCEASIVDAVRHALSAGSVLGKARLQFTTESDWSDWCRATLPFSLTTANVYVRLDHYRDLLDNAQSVQHARRMIAGMPPFRPSGPPRQIDIVEAQKLRAAGLKYREIAAIMGFHESAVWKHLNRSAHDAHLQRAADRNHRRRAESVARAAKHAGISEMWAALHRLGEQMDAFARGTGATPELRAAVEDALSDHYRCRDKISRVLGAA